MMMMMISDTFSGPKLMAIIKDLNIPIRNGDKLRYKDTFLALVKRAHTLAPDDDDDDMFDSESSESEEGDSSGGFSDRDKSDHKNGTEASEDDEGNEATDSAEGQRTRSDAPSGGDDQKVSYSGGSA